MSYQTFTAKSVDEAKRQMRQALGDDAVILSTRRHADGTVEMRGIKKGKPLFKGEAGPSAPRGGLFARAKGETAPAPSLGGGEEVTSTAKPEDLEPAPSLGERATQGAQRDAMSSLRGEMAAKLDRTAEPDDPLLFHYRPDSSYILFPKTQ